MIGLLRTHTVDAHQVSLRLAVDAYMAPYHETR